VISKEGLLHENIAMGALCVKAPVCFKVLGIKANTQTTSSNQLDRMPRPRRVLKSPKLGIAQRT
jgi:hypothetical protein